MRISVLFVCLDANLLLVHCSPHAAMSYLRHHVFTDILLLTDLKCHH